MHSLLEIWLTDQEGLLYLANCTDQINILARALLGENRDNNRDSEAEDRGDNVEELEEG